MKNPELSWIAIAVLAAIAFVGKDACLKAAHFAMALALPSHATPTASVPADDAAKALGLGVKEKTQDTAAIAKESDPAPEPNVYFLRTPIDVPSAIGKRHLAIGTRVTQLSEDHTGTCVVDDGTSRFSVNFSQLTQYQKVADLLKAKEMAQR